jgi:hypothetical protein
MDESLPTASLRQEVPTRRPAAHDVDKTWTQSAESRQFQNATL